MSEKLLKGLDAQGKKFSVPEKDASTFVASGGKIVSNAEAKDIVATEKYEKNFKGGALSTLAGALSPAAALANTNKEGLAFTSKAVDAATMGFGDAATVKGAELFGGKEAADNVRGLFGDRELSPIASGLGTAAGVAANMAVTAGAGSLLEGAQGVKALSSLSKVMPAGSEGSTLAKVGLAALKSGAQGAGEGLIMGIGDELSRAALADEKVTAEKLLAAAGHSSAIGGLTGGLLGGLFAGGSTMLSGLKKGESKALSALAETEAEQLAKRGEKAVESLENSALKAEKKAGSWLSNASDEYANEFATRSLGGSKRTLEKAQEQLGKDAEQQVGKWMFKEGVIDPNAGFGSVALHGDIGTISEKMQAAGLKAGDDVGNLMPKDYRVKLSDFMKHAETAEQEALKNVATVEAAQKVKQVAANFETALRANGSIDDQGMVALADIFKQRQNLDKLSRGELGKVNANAKQVVDGFRDEIEKTLIEKLDAYAPGEGLGGKWTNAKYNYKVYKIAEKMMEDGANKAGANQLIGFGEKTAGILGGGIGGIPGAALAMGGAYWAKTRGNATAAYVLKKLAGAEGIQRSVNELDLGLTRAARGMVGDVPKLEQTVYRGESPAQIIRRSNNVAKNVTESVANPEAFAEKLSSQYAPIAATYPGLANEMTRKTIIAMNFLHSKAPAKQGGQGDMFSTWKENPSDYEARKFLRYVDAVDRPMDTFKKIEKGDLSQEAVEALRAIHPQVFADLQLKTMEMVAQKKEEGKPLPYKVRLKLGMLLDITTDPLLAPKTMEMLQAPLVATDEGLQAQGPSKPVKIPSTLTAPSELDRLG